jgi:hypothetical protein
MELSNGVKAVSLDGNSWEFRSELVQCIANATMDKVGSGKAEMYRVSIPYYGSTKNQMFKDRDSAFKFVNNFILREA